MLCCRISIMFARNFMYSQLASILDSLVRVSRRVEMNIPLNELWDNDKQTLLIYSIQLQMTNYSLK